MLASHLCPPREAQTALAREASAGPEHAGGRQGASRPVQLCLLHLAFSPLGSDMKHSKAVLQPHKL